MAKKKGLLPIFQPNYDSREVRAVSEVLRSGWIGLGPKTDLFEERFASYVGAKYAVALNSATAALHLALVASGVGAGDEVILPSLTFVSTAHAVLYVGAKPIFADVEPDTMCLSPEDVEQKITKRTKAMIPVHYGGHPCDMKKLRKIARQNKLTIIEDASHACGSIYQGKHIGSISPFTCFSFHAVKNLATGDGGMVTTNNKSSADCLKRLRWVGITKDTWKRLEVITKSKKKSYKGYGWHYEVKELGYKYHMNDIAAALGLVQLNKLDKANRNRRKLAERYTKKLSKVQEVKCPAIREGVVSAQHNYVIRCDERDEIHLYLRKKGFSSGVHYMPVHLYPFYRKKYSRLSLPTTEAEWPRLLTLPLYPSLTFQQQNDVIKAIKEFYQQ
jgi:perosamine synthetase